MRKIDSVLQEKIATLVSGMGYELIGCEFSQGKPMVFRVYIDKKEGLTIEDCSLVSRQIGAMLDVEDLIKSHYTLEVSSPGIDRPLFTLEQFHHFVGSRVKIRLYLPINERRQYKGILKRIEGEEIYLLADDSVQEVILPFSAIEKANLIGDIRL